LKHRRTGPRWRQRGPCAVGQAGPNGGVKWVNVESCHRWSLRGGPRSGPDAHQKSSSPSSRLR